MKRVPVWYVFPVEYSEWNSNPYLQRHMEDDTDSRQSDGDPLLLKPMETSDNVVDGSQSTLRDYGSGLGNLGNTCFMNSSLQCLVHTDPLKKYFLSGDFSSDLNRDNPLGTGGELAVQFASLMRDMWLSDSSQPQRDNSYGYGSYGKLYNDASSTNVVHPRKFKLTLGKHAEQFMGYDQHDSQELATYLLDALHEDTNRVSKKPYIEKPEQGDDESDEDAANKAWELHLKREDSFIMNNFMAQVKSRVQCCEPNCGRVSTTFDPIMFLSVPVPGTLERSIEITFVPLPGKDSKNMKFSVTVVKTATIADLLDKVIKRLSQEGIRGTEGSLSKKDLVACDVWHHEVHAWHELESGVEGIRDTDFTFIYEIKADAKHAGGDVSMLSTGMTLPSVPHVQFRLEDLELGRLNAGKTWVYDLKRYLKHPEQTIEAFTEKVARTAERVKHFNHLLSFVKSCVSTVEDSTKANGGAPLVNDDRIEVDDECISSSEPDLEALKQLSAESDVFQGVHSRFDVAVLLYVADRVRTELIRLEEEKRADKGPISIEVRVRSAKGGKNELSFPLVLRMTSSATVYALREELSMYFSAAFRNKDNDSYHLGGLKSDTMNANPNDGVDDFSMALMASRRAALFSKGHSRSAYAPEKPMGSIGVVEKADAMAMPTNDDELEPIGAFIGDHEPIYVDLPEDLMNEQFKEGIEYVEDLDKSPEHGGPDSINVLDCIDQFCQKEQLEETEMWYCSNCQKHVRAWKQFHLYRAPPILIIHLKRFHYSARSHRRDKINKYVDFPLEGLDLSGHVLNWQENEKPIYDCYAVSNHYGGLGGGHYTAHALNTNGEWCYYDDSRVTTNVDPKEAVSSAAYVLYYRRQDVKVNEDFVPKWQTPEVTTTLVVAHTINDTDSAASGSQVAADDDMELEKESPPADELTTSHMAAQ